jgi:hypothetical protein
VEEIKQRELWRKRRKRKEREQKAYMRRKCRCIGGGKRVFGE